MIKLKTNHSVKKRYKITAKIHFLRSCAFKSHLLRKKSNKQKRKLSQKYCIHSSYVKNLKLLLPYFYNKK